MAIEPLMIYALRISPLNPDEIELTTGILAYLEVEAIEEEENGLIVYHQDPSFIETIKDGLLSMAPWVNSGQISESSRPNENWNKSWEASFNPIVIEDFCTIKASFHEQNFNTPHIITIDPEMAFGTGHHETTYGMIQMMRNLDFCNQSVMDYGTGTGILAILAEKLGARSVFAFDYDEVAMECAERCIVLNDCTRISCKTGVISDLSTEVSYDIVLANINRNVLLDSAVDIEVRNCDQGILIVSGIMLADEEKILDRFQSQGYRLKKRIANGDWLCLNFKLEKLSTVNSPSSS